MSKLTSTGADRAADRAPAVEFVHSKDIPALFTELKISLLVSTYQAQRIMSLAPNGPRLAMLMRVLPRPTGLALEDGRLAVAGKNQIWIFRQVHGVRDQLGNALPHDLYLAPRQSFVTGDIAAHQLAWQGEELLVVNTRFSCLCTLSSNWSFVAGWRPRFITALAAEDRCHLNGLAMRSGKPAFLTALGVSDQAEGWRTNRAAGGCLIDYASGEPICTGLSMPHSPLWHDGKLWLLESGSGNLVTIDPNRGTKTEVAHIPGYARGLTFIDRYAVVGLSKIREKNIFGGLPIEERYRELPCAIHFIDLESGTLAGLITFTKGIEELFDIQLLRNTRAPFIVGFEEDTINGLYVIPN